MSRVYHEPAVARNFESLERARFVMLPGWRFTPRCWIYGVRKNSVGRRNMMLEVWRPVAGLKEASSSWPQIKGIIVPVVNSFIRIESLVFVSHPTRPDPTLPSSIDGLLMASRPDNPNQSLRQLQVPPPPRVMPIWLTDIPAATKPTTPLALTGVTPCAQRRGRPHSRSRLPACPAQQRVLRERTPVRSVPEPSRLPRQPTPGRRERTPSSNPGPSSTTKQFSPSPSPMSEIDEAVDAATGGSKTIIAKPRNPLISDVKLVFQQRYANQSEQIQDEQYIKFRVLEDAGKAYLDSAKALANQLPEHVTLVWAELTRKYPWLADTRDNWPAKTILQSVYHNSAARQVNKQNRTLIKQVKMG
ncbi:hypothetical protein C8F01DRAFT_1084290 [Mycena amicta]|nr:hypothetical protein C8F01DRAFT_1084290 [Mycena amicta]